MAVRLHVMTLLLSMTVFACGAQSRDAKRPEVDPWADYKGTYATAAGASGSASAGRKTAKVEAAQTEAPKAAPVEVADKTPASPPISTPAPAARKKSKAGVVTSAAKAKSAPKTKK